MKTVVVSDVLVPAAARREARRGGRVVTPNQEAARSLGVSSQTLDGLAGRVLAEAGFVVATPLVERRLLREAAVRAAGVSDPTGFASAAASALRELMRAGTGIEALASDPAQRIRRLAGVVAEARRLAREQDVVLAADALWRGAEVCLARSGRGERVVVVGYPRVPFAERRFLDAFAGEGSVLYLPCPDGPLFAENRDAVRHFRDLGWTAKRSEGETAPGIVRRWLGARGSGEAEHAEPGMVRHAEPAASPTVDVLTFPDHHAEARGVLGEVKRLLREDVPSDRIAIVARQEQAYGPVLLEVAAEIEVPLRVLYDIPLTDTRLGAWLTDGLDAMERRWSFEDAFRWLTDPICDGLPPDLVRRARESHPTGVEAWAEFGIELPEPWSDARTRSRWIDRLTALSERFGAPTRAAAWPREAIAVQRLVDGLRALDDPAEELEFDAFRAELRELLGVLQVPASPRKGGVELHTPLSLFGADADHVFVVGAAEGQLPAPIRPDPFLDPVERSQLRDRLPWLDDVRAQARREEINFWAVLQCVRERLVLSYPTLTARSETLPSPYLARLGVPPRSPDRRDAHSLVEVRRAALRMAVEPVDDPVLAHARHAYEVESRRESGAAPGPHDGITGRPFAPSAGSVSATRVIDHASCPFRFWAGVVLRIEAVREAPTTLDPLLRGSLIHDTLEHAVRRAIGRADLRTAALEALDGAMSTAAEELEAERAIQLSRLPGWDRERADLLRLLRRAIRSPDFLAEGAHVVALEQRFRGTWQGIAVHGRIDRIDVEDGGAVLIDYKSGGSVSRKAKDASGRASLDLQLPIYREGSAALLAEVAPDAEPERTETKYLSISKAAPISSREPSADEQERVAAELGASWRAGSFPVDPDRGFDVCRTCPYDAVCRKGPRLERMRRGT